MKMLFKVPLRFTYLIVVFMILQLNVTAQSSCNDALTIVPGLNQVDNSSGKYWYKYVASEDCRITLNTNGITDADSRIILYLDSCTNNVGTFDDVDYQNGNLQSYAEYVLQNGDELYIEFDDKWITQNGGTSVFNVEFTVSNAVAGDACFIPIVINQEASLEVTKSIQGSRQYFSYTPTKREKLTISDGEFNSNYCIIYTSCEAKIQALDSAWNGELTLLAESGVTYNIVWMNQIGSQFTWTIDYTELGAGYFCNDAITINPGLNNVDNSFSSYWFKYVADSTCRVILNTYGITDADSRINLYLNSCSNLVGVFDDIDLKSNEFQTYAEYVLNKADVLYIEFDNEWIKIPGYQNSIVYDVNFSVASANIGDACDNPIVINPANSEYTISKNVIGAVQYYSYTPSVDEKIEIYSTDNEFYLYQACDFTQPFDTSGVYYVKAGISYTIEWRTHPDLVLDWTFKHTITKKGEICEISDTVKLGENIVDNSKGNFWYTYSANEDCQITISTDGLTTENTAFMVYKDSCSNLYLSNDDISQTNLQSELQLYLKNGDVIFIEFLNENTSASYPMSFTKQVFAEGEGCINPIVILPNNTVDFSKDTSGSTMYFSFVADKTGMAVVTADAINNIEIIKNCDVVNKGLASNTDSIEFTVVEGNEYILKWTNTCDSAFSWLVSIRDFLIGETCNNPIELQAGQLYNFTKTQKGSLLYFRYINNSGDSKVMFSDLQARNSVYYIGDDCSSSPQLASTGGDFSLMVGDGYGLTVAWENTEGKPFSVQVTTRSLAMGDNCEMPIVIQMNTDIYFNNGIGDYLIYRFKAQETGYYSIIADADVKPEIVFVNANCETLNYDTLRSTTKYEMTKGEDISFILYNSDINPFMFSIVPTEVEPGMDCLIPLDAVIGKNSAKCSISNKQWFEYTANDTITAIVSSCGATVNTYVKLYLNSCDNQIAYNDDFDGCNGASQIQTVLMPGDVLKICWSNTQNQDFDWILTIRDIFDGETIEKPIEVVEGINTASPQIGLQYYSYTATGKGRITISSCGLTNENTYLTTIQIVGNDTILQVYDDECGLQSKALVYVEENEIISIIWTYLYPTKTFNWGIGFQPFSEYGTIDTDNDGTPDYIDAFPNNPAEWVDTDGDGIGNNADLNDDNDSALDVNDDLPLDSSETVDTDYDGIGNNKDTDDDGDGTLDIGDKFPLDITEQMDSDDDGIGNNADPDDDNDGVFDTVDELPYVSTESLDFDKDGTGNNADVDDDNDGVNDNLDLFPLDSIDWADIDEDEIGDNADIDDDNDNAADSIDEFPLDYREWVDTDKDGYGNNLDMDDDGDLIPDFMDPRPLVFDEDVKVDELSEVLHIYPNPANDYITIPSVEGLVSKIQIITSSGTIAKNIENSDIPSNISISDLADGSYIVIVKTDKTIYTGSFIKK